MFVSTEIVARLFARLHSSGGSSAPRLALFPDGVLYTIDLHGGPGGGHVLRSDGGIFSWDVIEPGFRAEQTDWRCVQALAIAARRLPELRAALPRRPSDAHKCYTCMGTGFTDRQNAPQYVVCNSCNGLGWRNHEPATSNQ